ncbi:transposase [Nonomuraea sp. NPDC049152]|uniref:RNA-guided endonuclease InsQ/TnpB family protein n=1 Tax=Nonomuraea sp. NPDC049152 TaxID=3154350 RepID=UPI00340D4E83
MGNMRGDHRRRVIVLAFHRSEAKCVGLPSVIQLRLNPVPGDAVRLAAAMELCNEAATFVSRLAWSHRTFKLVALHRLACYEARAAFTGNLAVTSDGVVLPGAALPGTIRGNAHVRAIRARRHRQRRRLQRKRSSSARRILRRMSGREHRMMTDVNHQISKHMVRETERTGRGIAMEQLHGIRGRARAYRSQRRTLHSWAFAQQIAFTRYKAARLGIAFALVDPSYTSQCCPECGFVSKANRPVRGRFLCTRCGLAGHADHIAARNIAQRAVASGGAVNRPHATGLPSSRWDRESKSSGSPGGS